MAQLTRLKASTLVESLVSMVIITICMAMAFTLVTKIERNSNPILKLKAYTEVQKVIFKAKKNNQYEEQSLQIEGLLIICKLNKFNDYKNIMEFNIEVFNTVGNRIMQRKELIKLPC